MDVSENSGTPKSSHSNRVFYYKPSILGFPYFWKHPYKCIFKVGYRCRINPLNTGFSLDALKILILEVILFNHYPLINGWCAQGISPISPTVDVFPASFWQIPAYMFEHGIFETSDNEKINLKKNNQQYLGKLLFTIIPKPELRSFWDSLTLTTKQSWLQLLRTASKNWLIITWTKNAKMSTYIHKCISQPPRNAEHSPSMKF